MFHEIVNLHHQKIYPSSKDLKVSNVLEKLGTIGRFKYSVTDLSKTVHIYSVKFGFGKDMDWDAEIQEMVEAQNNEQQSQIVTPVENFVFRGCKIIKQPSPPAYPKVAKFASITGVVKVDILVGLDGKPEDVKVVSGNAILARSVIEYARQFVFSPTTLNESPRREHFSLTVPFRLEGLSDEVTKKLEYFPSDLSSADLENCYSKALQYWESHRFRQAGLLFSSIEQVDSKFKHVQYYLGVESLQLGDMSTAKMRLKRVIDASDTKISFNDQPMEVKAALAILRDLKSLDL